MQAIAAAAAEQQQQQPGGRHVEAEAPASKARREAPAEVLAPTDDPEYLEFRGMTDMKEPYR